MTNNSEELDDVNFDSRRGERWNKDKIDKNAMVAL